MIKNQYIKTIAVFVLLLYMNIGNAQKISTWQPISSPLFSDLKKVQFIAPDTAIISGKQLLILNGNKCKKFQEQPPCEITAIHAVSSDCIFVSNETPYQNSYLYHWNGQKWQEIYNPMANNIVDMFFTDNKNGVLVSYGEIALMINGKWHHINPPTNRVLLKVFQNSKKELIVLTGGKGIYKYVGNKWISIKKSSNSYSISKVKEKIYVTGYEFLGIIKSDSLITLSKDKIWASITSISKNKKGELIGVGSQGKIVHFSNGIINYEESLTEQNLTQIINQNDTFWCIGNEGTILKYSIEETYQKPILWKGFEVITFNQQAKIIDDEYGVIAADFNNDGWTDIFTCGLFEQEHLYINQKDLFFADQSKNFQLSDSNNTVSNELNLGACAGDIDNDGYIDLYVGVLNGSNKIYKNIKGKYFVDYSSNTGGIGKVSDRTNACIMGDVDNDGDLDIFITNEYSTNRLYLNNGVGIFKEVTKKTGLETIEGGNSATFGDIDNDGDIDLYVTNWSSKNILYQNQFTQKGVVYFNDITEQSQTGGDTFTKSNASIFSDIDKDGDLDLFVTNRKTSNRLYINNGKGIFNDQTEALIGLDTASSYGAVMADFDGDSYKDLYVLNVGDNIFYKNEKGYFKNQTIKYEALVKGYSTGAALSDFDNDGDLDVYIANYVGASSALLHNKKKDKKHITLLIKAVQNNRNAIGAKIYVYDAQSKLLWFDEIRAGSGYVSVNELKKVIPIQNHKKVNIKVVYPNGITKNVQSISKGSIVKITDVEGLKKTLLIAKHFLKKRFYDPHNLFEFTKWIFVLTLITLAGYSLQKKHHWKLFYLVLGGLFLVFFYLIQYSYFEYKPFLYATILPLTSIIMSILLTYYYFERKFIKKTTELEKNNIKTKLSRDLHDDLASTVSSIGFYLTLIKFNIKDKNSKISEFIQKSENLLQDATDAITDLIWSINPKPETLNTLLLRIQKNHQALFKEKNIHLELPNDTTYLTIKLEDTVKQNIFLIIKEALNNILKYAEATQVSIEVHKKGKATLLTIKDNGKGFDYHNSINKGNGLLNIQKRAEEIQANISIVSKEGKGTIIKVIF